MDDSLPERAPTIFSMTLASLGVQKLSEYPGQHPRSYTRNRFPASAKICLAIKPNPSVYYFPSPTETPVQGTPSPWPSSTLTFFFLVALQELVPNHPRREGLPPQAAPQPPLLCRWCPFLSYRSLLSLTPQWCLHHFSSTPFKSKLYDVQNLSESQEAWLLAMNNALVPLRLLPGTDNKA